MTTPPPQNGTKTHPLSATARAELRSIERQARPAQEMNPGVTNRLLRGGLAELVEMASPYASHKPGTRVNFMQITAAGRAELDKLPVGR